MSTPGFERVLSLRHLASNEQQPLHPSIVANRKGRLYRVRECRSRFFLHSGLRQRLARNGEVTSASDAVRLMAAVGWHFDNADDDSQEMVVNAWNGVLEFLEKETGIEGKV